MKRISVLALSLFAVAAFVGCPKTEAPPKKSADAVKLEFFVMSQCPFGVQAVDKIKEVVEKMGSDLDFTMDFIGNVAENGDLSSMHGADEVKGDIIQLCAAKLAPKTYLDLVACQNKNYREVAKNWEACATETKIPVEKLRACIDGPEGKALATASFNKAKERSARGSPTIYLAGANYSGKRTTIEFFRAICAAHKGATKPAACQNIPEPPKVNVTILADKRCTECNADRYQSQIKWRVANPVITVLDYSDAEGKKLFEEVQGKTLPMVLFDSTLNADKDALEAFQRNLTEAGNYRILNNVRSDWNPLCGDAANCKLPECKDTMTCRAETPNTLEVFVMSQCPFGVRALNAMEAVLKNFGDAMKFKIHFIANGTAESGFSALHGQPEVEENIRELCSIELYGKKNKYMDYILCRNKDIKSADWQKCATGGINAKAMQSCIDTKGKKLHEEDIKIANALGIGGSPTWIVNGKYKFSGADAETIRSNFCKYNKVKGCENSLAAADAAAAPPPPAGSCGN